MKSDLYDDKCNIEIKTHTQMTDIDKKDDKVKKKYRCEKCLEDFDKKDSYDKHMNRKISCDQSKTNVNDEIKELKTEVKKLKKSKIISTNEDLQDHFHKIHNLYRSKEGMSELEAMKEIMILFSIKLFEPLIKKKIIDLPIDCCFSELIKETDEEKLFSKVMKDVIPKFYKNELTKEYFDKPKITKPYTVFKTFEYLDEIDYNELNEDLIGRMYEYFIGRQKSTNQGLGQYFTNRKIVELFLDICEDSKLLNIDKNENIPTFCDPTCGTGGFLVSYVIRMMKKYPNLDWKKQQKNVYGYDISPMLITSAKLNLLVLTGVIFENLQRMDTMNNNINVDFDIFCGNPPYGGDEGDNINYDDLPENLEIKKKIGINMTKKANIFSQLFLIKSKKICAIVLPEGFYFGTDNGLVKLREKIFNTSNVKYIVEIPSMNKDGKKTFQNTCTNTKMIVFIKNEKTDKVNFIDIENSCKNKLDIILSVKFEEIKKNKYNLNYKRYIKNDNINETEYTMYKIDDLFKIDSGTYNASDVKESGQYPFYSGKRFNPVGYNDKYNIDYDEALLLIKGGGCPEAQNRIDNDQVGLGTTFYVTEKVAATNGLYVLTNKNKKIVVTKYAYYVFLSYKNTFIKMSTFTTRLGNLTKDTLKNMEIPLPSIERQNEIVCELDTYNDTLLCGEKMLKLMEKTLIYEVKNIIREIKCDKKKIKDFCEFLGKSKRKAGEGKEEGEYPFYICSDLKLKYFDEADYNEETIIIGDGGNPVIFIDNKFSCSSHNHLLRCNDPKYNWWLYYVICGNMKLLENGFEGTTIRNIKKSYIEDIEIPLPQLSIITKLKHQYEAIQHHKQLNKYYKSVVGELIQKLSNASSKKTKKLTVGSDISESDDNSLNSEKEDTKEKKIVKKIAKKKESSSSDSESEKEDVKIKNIKDKKKQKKFSKKEESESESSFSESSSEEEEKTVKKNSKTKK
ncbi:N-6 DNA methylase [Bodo saltans virus]|uniref:site-specific DNA-methyltransferase (adenine-specific) n=1 Tax=Bodo saltans virus TaxID=2024608 RepID=A0A2H4UVW8_9VIRU|nr:N-6 DNA methylase [Bodo saltans virus]ATZ81082.1 N-6 DNA methylase [Bodo saltans virus]